LVIKVIWKSIATILVGERNPSPQTLCHCRVSLVRSCLSLLG
jgi:hypothetical protein